MTIGIIVVAYNSASTIARTLKSISDQTFKPESVLIIDGKSTDDTIQVASQFYDLPLRIISEEDDGIYNAMNKGLRLIDTDIVGFLNSDDAYADYGFLERMNHVIHKDHNIKLYLGGVRYINQFGTVKRSWKVSEESLDFHDGGHPPHPGFYANRNLLMSLKGFNERYRIAADFDIMLRAVRSVKKSEVFLDNNIVVDMLMGGASNNSLKNILLGNSEIRHSLNSNGIKVGVFYTLKRLGSKALNFKFFS